LTRISFECKFHFLKRSTSTSSSATAATTTAATATIISFVFVTGVVACQIQCTGCPFNINPKISIQ